MLIRINKNSNAVKRRFYNIKITFTQNETTDLFRQ